MECLAYLVPDCELCQSIKKPSESVKKEKQDEQL
jgi:hypothetical protein